MDHKLPMIIDDDFENRRRHTHVSLISILLKQATLVIVPFGFRRLRRDYEIINFNGKRLLQSHSKGLALMEIYLNINALSSTRISYFNGTNAACSTCLHCFLNKRLNISKFIPAGRLLGSCWVKFT